MILASSMRSTLRTPPADWGFAWPWLLGFGLTVYLGLNGGGFDPLVSGQVGVAIWWILLFAVLVGAVPRRRPGRLALIALGLLGAFVVWTALSLRWTESTEKTAADLAQVATFLGVFALAVITRGKGGVRQMVGAVGAGIVVIALVALLSRLHLSWFPEASQTGHFLETGKERLSYPLDYWNGLAALIAISLPLLLQITSGGRHLAVRALASAALPAMFLTLFFTLSRNGIGGGVIAIAVYLALANDRLPKLLNLIVTGIGGGVLILLANHRYELVHGFTEATARSQGSEMLWLTIVVCAITGLARLGLGVSRRPHWARVDRRRSLVVLGVAALVVLVSLIAVDAPGRLSHAWHDFKQPSGRSEHGTSRLISAGGENRYQLWSSAVREFDSEPLTGTGSNTFQLWWTRDGSVPTPILDTHNLYLQTLGELGIVGLLLLAAFVGTTLLGSAARLLRAASSRRAWLAAAVAGSTVLWTTSIFDWMWKIPVIPIATLLLLAVAITADNRESEGTTAPAALRWPLRSAVSAIAIAALVAIAIPLAANDLLRSSQSDARAGDTAGALEDARNAQNVQPGAASPRLQEALIYESEGEYGPAETAAVTATEREPTNWQTWLLLSRIEAQNERPGPAIRDYQRARTLNPGSAVFADS
jgi:O-Antigen ligase